MTARFVRGAERTKHSAVVAVRLDLQLSRHNGVPSGNGGCGRSNCKYLKPGKLLVEQRGIEPLASALLTANCSLS